ncbi:MAG: hypothetical protein FJ320_05840 [SAR202 cluster bacterium]|nr:hypothetical protein [SAR202 cluster bacterium]
MAPYVKAVFTDDEVASQVLNIIRQAKKSVTIVSPYFEYWGHAVDDLVLALKNKVKVTVIVRNEPKIIESPQVIELSQSGIKVLAVDRLHAKIYLNENDVLVSSMNFTNYSTQNSKEIALAIRDEQTEREIRDYVENRLMKLSRQVGGSAVPNFIQQVTRTVSNVISDRGMCIRCKRSIPFDRARPLCESCFDSWSEYENEDYIEEFCHACGTLFPTTHAKPLCTPCFYKYR